MLLRGKWTSVGLPSPLMAVKALLVSGRRSLKATANTSGGEHLGQALINYFPKVALKFVRLHHSDEVTGLELTMIMNLIGEISADWLF